jgi:RNA polymerase primary sigma factor
MPLNNLFDHPAIKALISEGAREGRVSYSRVNDLLIDLELDEDDVEEIYTTLEKRAISIVDEAYPSPAVQSASAKTSTPKSSSTATSTSKPSKSKSEMSDLDDILAELDKLEVSDDMESVAQFIAEEEQEMYSGDDLDDNQAPVADALKIYLNRMGQIERLSPDEERRLAQVAHGADPEAAHEAKNALAEANLRLVVHMAKGAAARTTLSITDLLQEGNLGLLDAVERYRAQSNKTFGAYATWWIRRAMNRAINENSRVIRLSGELYAAIQKLQVAQRELSQKLGRTPSREEISAHSGLTVPQIEEAQRAASRPLSLDASVGSEDGTTEFGETLSDPDSEEIAESANKHAVAESIGGGEGARSSEDIATNLGISRERVHELELRAIRKLRKKAKGAGLDKLLSGEE